MGLDRETFWPSYSEDIVYPMAFRWASADPLSGPDFGILKSGVERIDSMDEILIVRGLFFRDEKDSLAQLRELAAHRVANALPYFRLDRRRILTEVDVQPINGDVRSHPFESIRFERLNASSLMKTGTDTFELCFPIKDSIAMPVILVDRLLDWLGKPNRQKKEKIHLTGTADGGGIAEPSDIAYERALYVKDKLVGEGWNEEQIAITTGQRHHPLAFRNRCVVVYYE